MFQMLCLVLAQLFNLYFICAELLPVHSRTHQVIFGTFWSTCTCMYITVKNSAIHVICTDMHLGAYDVNLVTYN